jgi:hypothetical protein
MIDSTGAVLRDDAGKIRYQPILHWADRKTAGRFSDAVIAALLARHPDALVDCGNSALAVTGEPS